MKCFYPRYNHEKARDKVLFGACKLLAGELGVDVHTAIQQRILVPDYKHSHTVKDANGNQTMALPTTGTKPAKAPSKKTGKKKKPATNQPTKPKHKPRAKAVSTVSLSKRKVILRCKRIQAVVSTEANPPVAIALRTKAGP